MKNCILCPVCKELAYFNIHFGAYFCTDCNWYDDTYNKQRILKERKLK